MTAAEMAQLAETPIESQTWYTYWCVLGQILQAARQGERQLTTAIPEEFVDAATKMLKEGGGYTVENSYNSVIVTIRW